MAEQARLMQAPAQERIRPIPASASPFWHQPDYLQKWQDMAKAPATYDPPQLAPGYIPSYLGWCNWWQQRSPLLAEPVCGCCCAGCLYKCCIPDREYLDFTEPDEWMMKMLTTGTSPKCPPQMKGIFWLQDNIAAHEHLVTFHDADWVSESLGLKTLQYNWTRGPTEFGAILFTFVKLNGNDLRMEISPDKKWISIAGSDGNPTWIYVPDEGETFPIPGGGEKRIDKNDMMRVSYAESGNPDAKITYQYIVRRIAYLDEGGKLVKTKGYHELRQHATEPLKYEPCCCGYCFCLSDEQRALSNFPQLPSRTVVRYAPPPPGAVAGKA